MIHDCSHHALLSPLILVCQMPYHAAKQVRQVLDTTSPTNRAPYPRPYQISRQKELLPGTILTLLRLNDTCKE